MRFPNYENTKFIKGIPEGWKIGEIGDLAEIKSGFAFKGSELGDNGKSIIKIRNITPYTIDVVNCDRFSGVINDRITKFQLKKGDLLIAMTGAQIGKVGLMPETEENYYLNQRVGKFFMKKGHSNDIPFVFNIVKSVFFQSSIENYAMGAAQPNISGEQIQSIKILLPNDKLLEHYSTIATPIFDEMFNLINQNENLKKTRDLLLPRLISGNLKIE